MAQRTVFCVEAFRAGPWGLERLNLLETFKSETRAREAAAELTPLVDGVVIYLRAGDPEFDCWSDPEVIAEIGVVPGIG